MPFFLPDAQLPDVQLPDAQLPDAQLPDANALRGCQFALQRWVVGVTFRTVGVEGVGVGGIEG